MLLLITKVVKRVLFEPQLELKYSMVQCNERRTFANWSDIIQVTVQSETVRLLSSHVNLG